MAKCRGGRSNAPPNPGLNTGVFCLRRASLRDAAADVVHGDLRHPAMESGDLGWVALPLDKLKDQVFLLIREEPCSPERLGTSSNRKVVGLDVNRLTHASPIITSRFTFVKSRDTMFAPVAQDRLGGDLADRGLPDGIRPRHRVSAHRGLRPKGHRVPAHNLFSIFLTRVLTKLKQCARMFS